MATFRPFGATTYYLNGSISSTATSITLSSFTEPVSGTPYTMALLDTDIVYATIAPKTSQSEFISFTSIVQNGDGTATLGGVTRGLAKKYPFTASATFRLPHSGQTQFIISNPPQLYNEYVTLDNAETIVGKKTFPAGGNANAPVSGTVYAIPTNDLEYVAKKYVDDAVVSGGVPATTTVLGISKMSTAPADPAQPISVGTNDTRVPTQDENDALVGNNTDIAVGTGNKYVTQTGLQKQAECYAASSTGNDTYVVTLSPVPTSLVDGMTIRFKPDTANTGAATLNVNSLGALAIVTGLSTALATGDILANQVCTVVYNSTGTVWELQNPASAVLIPTDLELFAGVGVATEVKSFYNFQYPLIISSDVPTTNFWTLTAINAPTSVIGSIRTEASADTNNSFITTNGIGWTVVAGDPQLIEFGYTKSVIVEFNLQKRAVGTEQMGWGLVVSGAPFFDYDDASVDAACFTVSAAGALYAHTSAGGGTTDHTETLITGVTLTDNNTYRIEFDPASEARFYVNGVLKATNNTTLPNSGDIKFGWGAEGNSSTNGDVIATAPWFAIEK